jgi:uncharacterized C2H2 Zn-finger protein
MPLGKCPKCGRDYHQQKTYSGVGGAYEVYIHKEPDGMGKMVKEVGRCTVNRPGEPRLLAGLPEMPS